jgi:hypothetical protein
VGSLNTGLLPTKVTASLGGLALEEAGGEGGRPGGGLAVARSASLSSMRTGVIDVC